MDGGWSEFGECSTSCGPGIRYRNCTNPKPAFGGLDCQGNESEDCNEPCSGKIIAKTYLIVPVTIKFMGVYIKENVNESYYRPGILYYTIMKITWANSILKGPFIKKL